MIGGTLFGVLVHIVTNHAAAETGYDAWLRYAPLEDAAAGEFAGWGRAS